MPPTAPLQVNTVLDLKSVPVSVDTIAFTAAGRTMGDGLGGFYRYDPDNRNAEDATYFNTVTSTVGAGRWVRIFQRVTPLPYGLLVNQGGVKTLYANAVTNSSGQAFITATSDGTAAGAALFTEIWQTSGDSTSNAGSANDAVIASRESISSDLKTVVYRFVRGNPTTLGGTLAGIVNMVLMPLRAVPTGTAVTVTVVGT